MGMEEREIQIERRTDWSGKEEPSDREKARKKWFSQKHNYYTLIWYIDFWIYDDVYRVCLIGMDGTLT